VGEWCGGEEGLGAHGQAACGLEGWREGGREGGVDIEVVKAVMCVVKRTKFNLPLFPSLPPSLPTSEIGHVQRRRGGHVERQYFGAVVGRALDLGEGREGGREGGRTSQRRGVLGEEWGQGGRVASEGMPSSWMMTDVVIGREGGKEGGKEGGRKVP